MRTSFLPQLTLKTNRAFAIDAHTTLLFVAGLVEMALELTGYRMYSNRACRPSSKRNGRHRAAQPALVATAADVLHVHVGVRVAWPH